VVSAHANRRVWCITTEEGRPAIEAYLKKRALPFAQVVFVQMPYWLQHLKSKFPGFWVYPHYWVFQRLLWRKAMELHGQVRFDVAHHATYGSLQMGSSLWRLGLPFVFGPVGGGHKAPVLFRKYFGLWWLSEVVRGWASAVMLSTHTNTIRALRHASLVAVENQDTYDLAKRYGAVRIRFASGSLLPADFGKPPGNHQAANDTLRLLWVGRLLPRKGLKLVLEALAGLDPSVKFQFTIIGDGIQGSYLMDWLVAHGLFEKVSWLKSQPMEVVKRAYETHDVFLFCSFRDSFASQIIESFAFGLPGIFLNHHGVATFVPDEAALKVDIRSLEQVLTDIRKAIELLYHDTRRRKAVGAAALEVSKMFTLSVGMPQVDAWYQEAIDQFAATCSTGPGASSSNGSFQQRSE
jgi:glycosyltransferase involved in cell wall biosynthesis